MGNQEAVSKMFDEIASSYDLVNRVLSFGQDIRWRKILVNKLPDRPALSVLDIATGTADILIAICQQKLDISRAVGVDLSQNMLDIAKAKLDKLNLSEKIDLIKTDARALPFADGSFDVVSIAFGIRNIVDISQGLVEMNRVLKKDGLALILEFSLPPNLLVKTGYLFYFRHLLPVIGGLLSKRPQAYRYLNRTVENFPARSSFVKILLDHGFTSVEQFSLCFGVATIYQARKS